MNAEVRQLFDDRTLRYSKKRMDQTRRITICTSARALSTYAGQVQYLVAANLLARMTRAVNLQPVRGNVRFDARLPYRGQSVQEHTLSVMNHIRDDAPFKIATPEAGDILFNLDPLSQGPIVHGSGWNAYVGLGPSPLQANNDANPFGSALAVVLAASQIFLGDAQEPFAEAKANALDWTLEFTDSDLVPDLAAGSKIWFVGMGSVGSATLYFLSFLTQDFLPTLIDDDIVKVENISRSPIFFHAQAVEKLPKVESGARFLTSLGMPAPKVFVRMLDQLNEWPNRDVGTPDVVVSAANERKVRYVTESGHPPVQVYATTGKNWQVALIRHVPLREACSLCLFPEGNEPPPQTCATADVPPSVTEEERATIDASVPFLSFLAGIMASAELSKLGMKAFPFTKNRVIAYTDPGLRVIQAEIPKVDGCFCSQYTNVHAKAIEGSKFAHLSWI